MDCQLFDKVNLCFSFLIQPFSMVNLIQDYSLLVMTMVFRTIAHNGISLAAGGDFGAVNCQHSMNLNRSTKLDLTTLPPLAANECYRFGLRCQSNF